MGSIPLTHLKFNIAPEKKVAKEDDPFLLGPGNISGATLNLGEYIQQILRDLVAAQVNRTKKVACQ